MDDLNDQHGGEPGTTLLFSKVPRAGGVPDGTADRSAVGHSGVTVPGGPVGPWLAMRELRDGSRVAAHIPDGLYHGRVTALTLDHLVVNVSTVERADGRPEECDSLRVAWSLLQALTVHDRDGRMSGRVRIEVGAVVGTGLLAGSDRRWIWDGTRLVEYVAARRALERLLAGEDVALRIEPSAEDQEYLAFYRDVVRGRREKDRQPDAWFDVSPAPAGTAGEKPFCGRTLDAGWGVVRGDVFRA
jgi:hypothetical protein